MNTHFRGTPHMPEPASCLLPRGVALVDEPDDGDGDGAEQEDVYEAFPAQDEFSDEPRGEQRRGQQTDVQVFKPPAALARALTSRRS